MELSILTNCKIVLAVLDQVDLKMTCYRSFVDDKEFVRQDIDVVEQFTDSEVSLKAFYGLVFYDVQQ